MIEKVIDEKVNAYEKQWIKKTKTTYFYFEKCLLYHALIGFCFCQPIFQSLSLKCMNLIMYVML